MRTGKSRKMREQGGVRRKMIAQERERQENRAESEGRKKRFAGTGMVRGRLICERNSRQVLTNLLTNSGG